MRAVLAMYLPQSSFVSTLLSEQSRGAAEGETRGFGEGGRRNGEAQGQRQRKGFVHALLLSGFGRQQSNEARPAKSQPIHCHYSWPGSRRWQKKKDLKEILGA